jgi:hypothetical protein
LLLSLTTVLEQTQKGAQKNKERHASVSLRARPKPGIVPGLTNPQAREDILDWVALSSGKTQSAAATAEIFVQLTFRQVHP